MMLVVMMILVTIVMMMMIKFLKKSIFIRLSVHFQ